MVSVELRRVDVEERVRERSPGFVYLEEPVPADEGEHPSLKLSFAVRAPSTSHVGDVARIMFKWGEALELGHTLQ